MADQNPYAQWATNPYAGFRPVGNPDPKKPLEIQRAQQEVVGGDIKNTKDAATQAADIRRAEAEAQSAEIKARTDRITADAATGEIPGDRSKTGAAYLATLPQGMADRIVAMYQGRVGTPLNPRNPADRLLSEAATHAFPDFDATKFNTRLAAIKNVATGPLGQSSNAIDTAIGHAGMLYDQASNVAGHSGLALAPWTGPLINHAQNAWNSGSPGLNLYRDTLSKLGPEEAKAYGAGTAGERIGMGDILSENLPLETKRATIRNALELFASKEAANAHQFDWGNMGNAKPSLDLLDPHARATLQRIAPDILNKYFTPSHDPMLVAAAGGPGAAPPGSSPPGAMGGPPNVPVPGAGGPAPQTVAQGALGYLGRGQGVALRTEHSDRLSAQVDAMVNAGASQDDINAALQKQGYPALDTNSYAAAKAWMAKNPGKSYFGATVDRNQPMSLLERLAGSAPGAFAANMANDLTAGSVGALAGDQGKGALAAMQATSPNASLAGTLVGGIGGAAGAELGAAKVLAPGLARFAPRIADAAYGGMQGFNNADPGNGLTGAVEGAGLGLGGGYVGQKAMHAVGSGLKGVSNEAVQYLRSRGIPLTVGQTLSQSGMVGKTVKGLEDALTSFPGVGNMIDARRMEGLRAFNREAFQKAAPPGAQITATGSRGMQQVRQGVSDAYDAALNPSHIDVNDPQFAADVAQAQAAARAIPNVAPTFPQDFATTSLTNRLQGPGVDPNGIMSGRNFQEAYRGLGRDARGRAASDGGFEIGQVARQGQDALGGALERQNPGAFEGFLQANAANRRANVIADALKNAGNQAEELITPAQLNRQDIGSTSRLEGKINSASGNRPFYDLAQAGQAVLPSKLPDSGTMKRLAIGSLVSGGLGGAGYATGGSTGGEVGGGLGLGSLAMLALGGTRGGQEAMTRLLLDRPDLARTIGNGFQRYAPVGSAAGAGMFGSLLTGP